MYCQQCRQQLLELVYEEGIRPRRRLELLDHVDSCPMCHEEYTELLESRALLQEWPDEELSWGLCINLNYQTSPLRRWFAAALWSWLRWPVFRGATAALLLLVAVLAITQSEFFWNEGGLTVRAHLWKGNGNVVMSNAMSQEELLSTIDRIIAESEQRQNKLFGTAMIKMYEDLEIRNRYQQGEIQTEFENLQRQNETRWERVLRQNTQ
ncbi:MAG: hypothetical protein HY644_04045 [Acidobacteria bacterium]|nr:hypothetical protein [Acidobacteriota bacterium]